MFSVSIPYNFAVLFNQEPVFKPFIGLRSAAFAGSSNSQDSFYQLKIHAKQDRHAGPFSAFCRHFPNDRSVRR